MQLSNIPFQTTDWAAITPTVHSGTRGVAYRRTKTHGPIRIRMVEYSAGYVSDHWCEKGHILLCLEGELRTELKDGRVMHLRPGMSYEVADGAEPHRSSTTGGAKLFIVD
jgi:quercetin dioxygenase-like cupin family protein